MEKINQKRKDDDEKERIYVYEKTIKAIKSLSEQYFWDDIYVFGSVIKKGRFSKRSDIDIGIKGLNKFDLFRFVADLSTLLERDVDVIRLKDCHFSKKIIEMLAYWVDINLPVN